MLVPSMKYISVCSGIEAASVAWHSLGFTPVGFSEIEKFPCSVLAHHYPDVPNFGDMTKFEEWDIEPGSVDILVGGTPCQDLSAGGLQSGWWGSRSGLSWVFAKIVSRFRPKWVVWENVPNAIRGSHKRGFREFVNCFEELGYCVSWRILDARYFGVPQRRPRVFIVASLGSECSRQVLLEREGDCGFAPSEHSPPVAVCLTARGAGSLDDRETYVIDDRGIRHLTPLEHERLMGFPDDYTLVTHRGKPAADGPRYKAIGNSMAVLCMFWIGNRIKETEFRYGKNT